MKIRFFLLISFCLVMCNLKVFATAKTYVGDGLGGAGDGLFGTAGNWSPSGVPGSGDDVTIDNSVVSGTYTVTLPTGATLTTIRTLTINPSGANNITLTLPSGNTATIGLTVGDGATGNDDILLNNGAILKNSSGASSGTAITFAANSTFRINNGARYIHNTTTGNAGINAVLSTVSGT